MDMKVSSVSFILMPDELFFYITSAVNGLYCQNLIYNSVRLSTLIILCTPNSRSTSGMSYYAYLRLHYTPTPIATRRPWLSIKVPENPQLAMSGCDSKLDLPLPPEIFIVCDPFQGEQSI